MNLNAVRFPGLGADNPCAEMAIGRTPLSQSALQKGDFRNFRRNPTRDDHRRPPRLWVLAKGSKTHDDGATAGVSERTRRRDWVVRPSTPEAVLVRVPNDLVAVKRIIEAAEAIEPTLAKVLAIAALTGARRGELCALRWNDLDLQRGILTIARSVYEVAGGGWHEKDTKTHQLRHIPLDEVALGILRLHRDTVEKLAAEMGLSLADNAFMFCRSPAGLEPIRPDVLTKFTVRVAVRAGVPTHLHALRHFSATQGIALGYDVVTVSKRLGHRDPSVTLPTA